MPQRSHGACLCQAVRYEVEGDVAAFFLCHCSRCRKDTGSAHGANLFTPKGRLTWIAGTELVRTFDLPGTQHRKSFCTQCGSALPYAMASDATVVVPAGSLDSAVTTKPTAHICMASRAAWEDTLKDAPRFNGLPG